MERDDFDFHYSGYFMDRFVPLFFVRAGARRAQPLPTLSAPGINDINPGNRNKKATCQWRVAFSAFSRQNLLGGFLLLRPQYFVSGDCRV